MMQFSELAIKILAAYLVLNNLGNVLPFIITLKSSDSGQSIPIISVAGWVVIPFVIGIVLWILAPKIARKTIVSSDGDAAISEAGLVVAGTFLIGVYWALKSVGVVVGQLFSLGTINYGYVAVFIISLVLVLGGRFVVTMYHRLRTAGTGL
ncbi:hypothetical protein [Microbulbifer sp. GL-2]|uniref:hypothetical protein n=1 Tax=Microbulbifer sp. GL-2 TaxID=2591606 RepID=UPI001162EC80|nr:hypothetical protein [Microbulbifer sp. GL-2]BBM00116.1 hypothetical protein GL2_01900 [Microbulbifer sp. GL-2]